VPLVEAVTVGQSSTAAKIKTLRRQASLSQWEIDVASRVGGPHAHSTLLHGLCLAAPCPLSTPASTARAVPNCVPSVLAPCTSSLHPVPSPHAVSPYQPPPSPSPHPRSPRLPPHLPQLHVPLCMIDGVWLRCWQVGIVEGAVTRELQRLMELHVYVTHTHTHTATLRANPPPFLLSLGPFLPLLGTFAG
jgi:hypothetical protein